MAITPIPQPPRIARYVDGIYGVTCVICLHHKKLEEMKGQRSVCKECNFDPHEGTIKAETLFSDFVVRVEQKPVQPEGTRLCKGCNQFKLEHLFITKAGKNSPSCDKCRIAWAKANGNR